MRFRMKPCKILLIVWYITLIIIGITLSMFVPLGWSWVMVMLSITFFGGTIIISIVVPHNKFWKM